jgi:hypothetical protein
MQHMEGSGKPIVHVYKDARFLKVNSIFSVHYRKQILLQLKSNTLKHCVFRSSVRLF